jgi:hypothetical protein
VERADTPSLSSFAGLNAICGPSSSIFECTADREGRTGGGTAGLDLPIFNASIDRFTESASSKSLDVVVCNHPTGEHGLDILNDDDVSRGIIREAFEFLSRVLLWSVAGCGPTVRVRLRQGGGKLEPHLRGDGALRASQYCVWRGPATVADAAHGLA